MNILRQLRWKLTLSYTLVTVSAFLVVLLIMGGILLPRIFLANNFLNPTQLVVFLQENVNPLWSRVLSQSPVDAKLIRSLLNDPGGAISGGTITSSDFLRIGSMQFSVKTMADLQVWVIGPDGTLLGRTKQDDANILTAVGKRLDPQKFSGLKAPLEAALAGETDPNRLYSVFEPTKRIIVAFPVFRVGGEAAGQVAGAMVVTLTPLPTRADIPAHMLNIASRSVLIFLLGAGILGAVFGAIIANGVSTRFKHLSATTDAWSEGDFSRYIEDDTGDEISQFGQRLNKMARQLQNLLRRRQEMAISEERNRLARDLHDSAKQGALAASFELGTALTLFDRDPGSAKKHLETADKLVNGVRKELTNLVHELRPRSMDGQDFSESLKDYAMDWSNRSGIELNVDITGDGKPSIETRETLFRIAQEALANVTRHSAARKTEIWLEYGTDTVRMTIHDEGQGFEAQEPHKGLGLFSMRERAELLGGSFSVESAPGQGTQIVVTLPKGNDDEEVP